MRILILFHHIKNRASPI